jgi:hypothetical protein
VQTANPKPYKTRRASPPPADQLTNVLSHPAPYPNTLASLTLIILFSEMLKFSKIISSKSKNIYFEGKNREYF